MAEAKDFVVSPPEAGKAANGLPVKKVVVFGDGTFGTAVGTLIARNGHDVLLLTRNEARLEGINQHHRNPTYLADCDLPHNLKAALDTDPSAMQGVDLILHAIPVQQSQAYLEGKRDLIPPGVPIISLSKGIHMTSLKFMVDIIDESLQRPQPSAFLSGPSFAKELMDNQPTGLVVAARDPAVAELVQRVLASGRTRCYKSDDVIGVEVGGALKNVYAIAAGMASGLGFKANTTALLVTRACNEMKQLAVRMGAQPTTLAGLSGIGDLMLTCYGGASRNRTVGERLGRGETIQEIIDSMNEVAEGVPTAQAVVAVADREGMRLPLARAVGAVLAGKATIPETLQTLMALPIGHEDFVDGDS